MKETQLIMDMPITVEILGFSNVQETIGKVFDYFRYVDETFSTYKKNSEVSKINDGILSLKNASREVRTVFSLCEKTKKETNGYFNIFRNGKYDPAGLVKGWAIYQASQILNSLGCSDYFIDAGGDIQVSGRNKEGKDWKIGIRNPFNRNEIIKAVALKNMGIATSGTYIRGFHIYNPFTPPPEKPGYEIASLTVIGPNVYEADRFATAAFAMGKKGISFIGSLCGFEGYMVDMHQQAYYTSGFNKYVIH